MTGEAHTGIVAALDARDAWPREAGKGNARCPAHDDRNPSLSVSVRRDSTGVVLHDHAGCTTEAVMDALGLPMAALFDDYWTRRNGRRPAFVEFYDYTDEAGRLLFQVCRREDKEFPVRRPDGTGGWIWNMGGTRLVLYRLAKVIATAQAGGTVYVPDGEKDVAAFEARGFTATCNPFGAGKWRDDYAEFFRGAHVVVVADKDDAGRQHARTVRASLDGVAKSVMVVESAAGKDAHDHFAAGHGVLDFVAWEDDAGVESMPAKNEPAASADEGVAVLRALFGALVVDVRAATLDPLATIPGAPFLVPKASAQLAGPEGSGKSQVAQVVAYDVALAGGYALYLAGEVTHDEFRTRARKISVARDGELTDAAAAIWRDRVSFADVGDALPAIWRHHAAWTHVCGDFSLVVLDAVSDAGATLGLKFARDNDDWLTFFQGFVKPCQGRVALLMLDNIGHGEDAKTRALGASAKGHKVDIRLSSRAREQPLSLIVKAEKVRITNAPFRKGDRWVAYEAGCDPAVPFDADQIELERGEPDAPDPVAVVVAALRDKSPQGLAKLEAALRNAGVKGRSVDLRDAIKTMADDPDCPVRDVGQRGFGLTSDAPQLTHVPTPCPEAVSVSPIGGGTRTASGHDDTDPKGESA